MQPGQSLSIAGLIGKIVTKACNVYGITVTMLTQKLSNSAERHYTTIIHMALMRLDILV